MSTVRAEQAARVIPDPEPIERTALPFLNFWCGHGPVTITAADPEWRVMTTKTFATPEQAVPFLNEWNGRRGLFLNVNETVQAVWEDDKGKPTRPKKEHITSLRGLHIDVDCRVGKPKEGVEPLAPDVVEKYLKDLKANAFDLICNPPAGYPKPTAIVDSGGGYHVYYKFNEALPATPENVAKVEGLNRWLEAKFNRDFDNTGDVSRILRVPGCINIPKGSKVKEGRVPTAVSTIKRDGPLLDLTGLQVRTEDIPATKAAKAAHDHQRGTVPTIACWDDIGVKLEKDSDWDLLTMIAWDPSYAVSEHAWQTPELHYADHNYLLGPEKRSERVKSVVDRLVNRHVPAETIVAVLINPEFGVSAHVRDQKDPVDYAWRQLRHIEPEQLVHDPELVALTPIPDDLEPTDWLVPGLLINGKPSIVGGRGGVGKSLFQLHTAVGVALNRPFLFWKPKEAGKVLIINSEDDKEEMQRRLWAICKQEGIDPQELDGKLFTMSSARTELFEATFDEKGKRKISTTPFYDKLKSLIAKNDIALLIVDPFVELFLGLDENSNMDMKEVLIGLRRMGEQLGIPIMIAHHTRKGSSQEGAEQDAFRGGGAIVNAVRVTTLLEPMTKEDAQEYKGIPPEELVSVIDPKTNYFKKSGYRALRLVEHVHPSAGGRAAFVAVHRQEAQAPGLWEHTQAVVDEVRRRQDDRPFSTATRGSRDSRLDAWIEDNCGGPYAKGEVSQQIEMLAQVGLIKSAEWVKPNRTSSQVWVTADWQGASQQGLELG